MEKGTSLENHIWKGLAARIQAATIDENLSWGTLILFPEKLFAKGIRAIVLFSPATPSKCRIGDFRLPELVGFSLL